MLVKLATGAITGIKSAPERLGRMASLERFSEYDDFRTDDGYIYVRVRAISSRVNKNHDGWPAEELAKSYKTFLGKPIFVDHNNSDPERARGVVVDAKLHVEDEKTSSLDPYYASAPSEHMPATWIELLLETDAKSFPKLAKALTKGDIDGVSMGCNVERSKCSHCGNWASTPDEYCQHIQNKGAEYNFYRNGQKISKKSYEDCYDIGFFEISYVFDPADETALFLDKPRTAKTADYTDPEEYGDRCSVCNAMNRPGNEKCDTCGSPMQAKRFNPQFDGGGYNPQGQHPGYDQQWGGRQGKTADTNALPQSEMTVAPEKVDTLRQEQVCPVCGSMMEDGICEVCNFEEPPEGFGNPDLTKAQDTDDMQQQQGMEAEDAQQQSMQQQQAPPGIPAGIQQGGQAPVMQQAASYITGNTTNITVDYRTAADLSGGRVNTKEKPLLPVTRQTSDKPRTQKTVSDSPKPVESNHREETMASKIADGPKPHGGPDTQPSKRVDVTGVGAVDENENPEGHKTVKVDGVGGVISDDGMGESANVEGGLAEATGPPTETWSGGKGDSAGQQAGVTGQKPTLGAQHKSLEILPWPSPDATADVEGDLKEEIGEGTKTWGGDSFHITDPITSESYPTEGGVTSDGGVNPSGEPFPPSAEAVKPGGSGGGGKVEGRAAYRTHMITAMKLAETEIALGITEPEAKFDRIAELEDESPESLAARLDTVSKVKTAGLVRKVAAAKRPQPSLQATSSLRSEAAVADDDAEGIFH